ncbi:MAG: hypothetical protein R3281_11000 [Balneolaceae bacterium]|nr:hypothetical protein [Balneolaceae bacterium]
MAFTRNIEAQKWYVVQNRNTMEKVSFLFIYSFEQIREHHVLEEIVVQLIFFLPLFVVLLYHL